MKRHLYILTLGLLSGLLLLTACQRDALLTEQEDISQPVASSTDSCYINLQIVNNTSPTTRATEAATAAENAVYDGILCIFEGTNETDAILKTATVIDQLINNPGNSTSIEVTQRLAVGTHAYTSGEHLYVLALLNTTPTGFTIGGTNHNELCFNGTLKTGSTVSQIQALTINSVGSTDKHVGLFMTNAPQDNGAGGITIMPEVTSTYLFDTPPAAGSRLTINVERAAARVRVTKPNSPLTLNNINLNGNSSIHPTLHAMTWTVNKYNTKSYAIRNGSTSTANWTQDWNYNAAPENTCSANDFSVYPQQSHSSDVVYIAENTTSDGSATDANVTEVIVEVKLKDNNSMLMHECFIFHPFNDFGTFNPNSFHDLYTSPEQFVNYLKNGLTTEQKTTYHLGSKTSAEVFKYTTITIGNNGSVTITLVNNSFSEEDQTNLNNLAAFLSIHTTGFRDGKMYYTYKIKHNDTPTTYGVVRNNAYNLLLNSVPGIGNPVPVP